MMRNLRGILFGNAMLASSGVATVAMLLLASIALGSTGARQAPAAKSPITILNRVSAHANGDFTHNGRFILALNGVIEDSGSTSIRPTNGTDRTVDGQVQEPVFANNTLTGKKGILSISIRGVSIVVHNFDPTKRPFVNEYGRWKIVGGSGIYKGWKGGGRWADVGTPATDNIEWNGYVTH